MSGYVSEQALVYYPERGLKTTGFVDGNCNY